MKNTSKKSVVQTIILFYNIQIRWALLMVAWSVFMQFHIVWTMNKLSFVKRRPSEPRSTYKHQQKSDLPQRSHNLCLYCMNVRQYTIVEYCSTYDTLSMRLVDYFEFMASDKSLTPRNQYSSGQRQNSPKEILFSAFIRNNHSHTSITLHYYITFIPHIKYPRTYTQSHTLFFYPTFI